jgi:hypothetical protein
MSLTIAAWVQKNQPHSDVFYRSVGYQYMDPETVLEGKGMSGCEEVPSDPQRKS